MTTHISINYTRFKFLTIVNTWIGFEQQKLKEEQGQMLIATNLANPNKQYQEG